MKDGDVSSVDKSAAREDAMWLDWRDVSPRLHDKIHYQSNPLVARVYTSGHRLAESRFGPQAFFDRVLEVGAGAGIHLKYVRHRFLRYCATDVSQKALDKAAETAKELNFSPVEFEIADATALPYPDNSFDRLISVFTLETLSRPHEVLKEWRRVIAPGGVISIVMPTEGGLAWSAGRYLTTRRSFLQCGLDPDYILSRERINACYRLAALIRHYFREREEVWRPLRLPIAHLNLLYGVNLVVEE